MGAVAGPAAVSHRSRSSRPAGGATGSAEGARDGRSVWRVAIARWINKSSPRDRTRSPLIRPPNGKVQRTYFRPPGAIVGDAFSPDGRWLAILSLESDLELQLIDLWNGSSQVALVGHVPNAKLPGMSCPGGCAGKVASWTSTRLSGAGTKGTSGRTRRRAATWSRPTATGSPNHRARRSLVLDAVAPSTWVFRGG